MNINEKIKRRAKPLVKGGNQTSIEPKGAFLIDAKWFNKATLKTKNNMFLKNKSIWLKVKLHGFHGNTLNDIKEWGCTYKNTHISAATHLGIKLIVRHSTLT